jgi:hypothetical protein
MGQKSSGSMEDSIALTEHAMSIHPHDAFSASWCLSIGRVHLVRSRTNEAIDWLERAEAANSELPGIHAWLASAYALNGETGHQADERSNDCAQFILREMTTAAIWSWDC